MLIKGKCEKKKKKIEKLDEFFLPRKQPKNSTKNTEKLRKKNITLYLDNLM